MTQKINQIRESKQAHNAVNMFFTLALVGLVGLGIGGQTGATPKGVNAQQPEISAISEMVVEAKTVSSLPVSSQNSQSAKPKHTKEQVEKVLNGIQSPISAEGWIKLSEDLDFPLDFLLVVAFQESHFGTKGRAVETKNIYNVGNTDCGDGKAVAKDNCNNFIDSWELGVFEFVKLIKGCYFDDGEVISAQTWIDRDFKAVRCEIKGKRYMSDQFSKFKYNQSLPKIQKMLS